MRGVCARRIALTPILEMKMYGLVKLNKLANIIYNVGRVTTRMHGGGVGGGGGEGTGEILFRSRE